MHTSPSHDSFDWPCDMPFISWHKQVPGWSSVKRLHCSVGWIYTKGPQPAAHGALHHSTGATRRRAPGSFLWPAVQTVGTWPVYNFLNLCSAERANERALLSRPISVHYGALFGFIRGLWPFSFQCLSPALDDHISYFILKVVVVFFGCGPWADGEWAMRPSRSFGLGT